MANYDLGTAHGKIVVDYQDKGTKQAGKDLDSLASRAKGLLSQFARVRRGWAQESQGLVNDVARLSRTFGVLSGAVAVATGLISRTAGSINVLRGSAHIVSSLGLALGGVPRGAEGFPAVVKRIIQLSAAITLFTASTKLIETVTKRFRLLGSAGGLVGRFGKSVAGLFGPLHAVAGVALSAANAVLVFRNVKALIKPVLLFTGALGALAGTLHIVAGLAVAIKDLSGAALILPAVLGAVGLALGTVAVAAIGMSDAFKAIAKGDAKALDEALKNLSPSAREFVLAIRDQKKAFDELRLDVQQRLFDGLGQIVRQLGEIYLPIVRKAMGQVASSFNAAIKDIASFFNEFEGSREVADDVAEGLDYSAKAVDNLTRAAGPLVRALYMIWRVGTEVFVEITAGAETAAKRFEDFIGKARATGDLKRWMQTGVQAFRDLLAIIKNVGLAIGEMWRGLNGGESKSFLATLRDLTARFNDFLRSAEGQRVLGLLAAALDHMATSAQKLGDAFVKYVLPVLERFLPIAERISGDVIDGIVLGLQILAPLFIALAKALEPIAPYLGDIIKWVTAFIVVLGGIGIAAKIVFSAFNMLKLGFDVLKGAAAVGGFAIRAFTGNLKVGERAVLSFAKALGVAALKSKAFRFGALIAGLGLVVTKMDEINIAAAGGAEKLDGYAADLHEFAKVLQGDFSSLKDPIGEIGDEWQVLVDKMNTSQSPFGVLVQSAKVALANLPTIFGNIRGTIAQRIQEIVDDVKQLPTKISTAIGSFGAMLSQKAVEAWNSFKTTASTKMQEVVADVQALPARIGTAIGNFGATLAARAVEAWNSFKLAAQSKFIEIVGDVQTLPFRIGYAIGSLIGQAATWAITTWNNFRTGASQKFIEIVADVQALPARIGTALLNLGATLLQKAVEAWESFRAGSAQKTGEVVTDAQSLPQRIVAALASLGATLAAKAVEAWNSFKERSSAIAAQVIADIATFPSRAGAAIAALPGILRQKGQEALDGFRQSITSGTETALAFVRGIPGKIQGAIGNLGSLLVGAGRALIDGLLSGIKAGVQAMYDFVSGIAAGIAARKGPINYDRKLLIPAGNAIVEGLVRGMQQSMPMLWKTVGSITDTVAGAANLSGNFNMTGSSAVVASSYGAVAPKAWTGGSPAGSDGASHNNTFHVTIDAKSIAEMQSVKQFFDKVEQKARAGKGTR